MYVEGLKGLTVETIRIGKSECLKVGWVKKKVGRS